MSYQSITTDAELKGYCRRLTECDSIALDTEFVAEDTYRPVLCLIQVGSNRDRNKTLFRHKVGYL